jgi:hypothetical protein
MQNPYNSYYEGRKQQQSGQKQPQYFIQENNAMYHVS